MEEKGTVVELRGRSALVRLQRTAACAGCAAAGSCRGGGAADERLLLAETVAAAAVGDAVRVAVPARTAIVAAASRYLFPLAGLLLGAGVAQALAGWLLPGTATPRAAGWGGIAGALVGAILGRRWSARSAGAPPPARITRVLGAGVDSPGGGG
jgi:sigma-E factor negative regulatory protein RseC